MLFWPRPSERLSSVDFTGFTARGLVRGEGASVAAEWQAKRGGIWCEGEAGAAQYGQTHSSSPVPG